MSWLSCISPCLRPSRPGEAPRTYTNQGRTAPHWTEPLRMIYDHELVLFREGRFLVEIDGEAFDCPAGTFIVVPPGCWHVTYDIAGTPGHRSWSHFDWVVDDGYDEAPLMTFFPDRPQRTLLRMPPSFLPTGVIHGSAPRIEEAVSVFDRLLELVHGGTAHSLLLARAVLLELLVVLCDRAGQFPEKTAPAAPRPVENLRRLLDETAARSGPIPSISDLLSASGRSYAHLCRMFRREYGLPPLRYIHTVRMSRAKLLLRAGTQGVAEIAYHLGYESPSYFCQVFKRLTGISPSAYVRKATSNSSRD